MQAVFDSDKLLLQLFVERNRQVAVADRYLLAEYARTCSTITDFWKKCDNPIWILSFLEYVGCDAVPNLKRIGHKALREVEHLIVDPCDRRALDIVYGMSKDAVEKDTIREAYLGCAKESEHYSDRRTGLVIHHTSADYARDAARALMIEDELIATMFCIAQTAHAIVKEGEELHQVEQACDQRTRLFRQLADDIRKLISECIEKQAPLCPQYAEPHPEPAGPGASAGDDIRLLDPGWVVLTLQERFAVDYSDPLSVQFAEHALVNKISVMGPAAFADRIERERDPNVAVKDMDPWLTERIEEHRRFLVMEIGEANGCHVDGEDEVRDRM